MTRFEEAFFGWTESRLTQEEASRALGVCMRTFRRWSDRYEEAGLDGLRDQRLSQASRLGAPVAGGQVDKRTSTQFGRALAQLGIELIPAYSPEARGRSERAFRTHQDRLVKELAAAGITDMARANAYLQHHYRPAFNAEFARPPREAGSAFVASPEAGRLDAILCEQHTRRVGHDNCVRFHRRVLQIPPDRYRCHDVKAKVTVLYHPRWIAIRHGPRPLGPSRRKEHKRTVHVLQNRTFLFAINNSSVVLLSS